jgi:hypothetical protein
LSIKFNDQMTLRRGNFPLVRGGTLPPEALGWLAEVERVFPGTTKDIILVRKPNSPSPREAK